MIAQYDYLWLNSNNKLILSISLTMIYVIRPFYEGEVARKNIMGIIKKNKVKNVVRMHLFAI